MSCRARRATYLQPRLCEARNAMWHSNAPVMLRTRLRPTSAWQAAKRLHFAHNCHKYFPPMRGSPVFKEENALPGSKLHFSIDNRHRLAGARQDHADVRWHIIAALGTMPEVIGVLRR